MIYPNQFILTNQSISIYQEGEVHSQNGYNIVVHKDYSHNLVLTEEFIFYGECFYDKTPNKNNMEVLNELFGKSLNEKIEYINLLSGYFIILLFEKDKIYALNDAAGQYEVYYFNSDDKKIFASQPQLISPFLTETENQFDPEATPYIIENKINIFNKTPFEFIYKLFPNHLLSVSNNKVIRFYPLIKSVIKSNNEVAEIAADILENSILAYSKRKKIAMALTAGWDSRILFAAALKILNQLTIFVTKHAHENGKIDAQIASEISNYYHIKLKIIEYNKQDIEKEYYENAVWKSDKNYHLMSILMSNFFKQDYIINGNVSEIARNFFDPLPKKLNAKDICYILGLPAGNYELKYVDKWLEDFKEYKIKGYHVLDFIYWEQKMSNWAGNSKSISNLYTTVISPFNNRYLLDTLLSTKRKDREKSNHKIYRKILDLLAPELNNFDINPTKKNKQIKRLKKYHLYKPYRILFFKLKKLKF